MRCTKAVLVLGVGMVLAGLGCERRTTVYEPSNAIRGDQSTVYRDGYYDRNGNFIRPENDKDGHGAYDAQGNRRTDWNQWERQQQDRR